METNFYMYSAEGNAAVAKAIEPLLDDIRALRISLDSVYKEVARQGHPEVYDTEPRVKCLQLIEKALLDIEFIV